MEDVGILYGHLVYYMAIWHILRVLVSCSKNNLATLNSTWKIEKCRKSIISLTTNVHTYMLQVLRMSQICKKR
jgi:hypothetical protein